MWCGEVNDIEEGNCATGMVLRCCHSGTQVTCQANALGTMHVRHGLTRVGSVNSEKLVRCTGDIREEQAWTLRVRAHWLLMLAASAQLAPLGQFLLLSAVMPA